MSLNLTPEQSDLLDELLAHYVRRAAELCQGMPHAEARAVADEFCLSAYKEFCETNV